MSKDSQHVVPSQKGGWAVRKSGSSRASKIFHTQVEAITYAKDQARKNHTELYVHGKDGTIRSRNSYGNDPFPPKDQR